MPWGTSEPGVRLYHPAGLGRGTLMESVSWFQDLGSGLVECDQAQQGIWETTEAQGPAAGAWDSLWLCRL